ncbi:helix-turn-helix domain-containing protein [Rhizobium sp. PL01]|uniref:helix-turn-helix domain-containing protein n=1 Tax=Rhizobium sp. PL01 TaxID=3085631 RepID=UPI00298260F1|nr:helix-turn-helix domain-containing protein [Rhizobium sp. PL01]MDW5317166.1 helix-turn-helix domain-containing protein [Rhizobium sp. PL01]
MPIPLSQTDLGIMTNASRQQVNIAMRRFVAAGWVNYTYRSITYQIFPRIRRRKQSGG